MNSLNFSISRWWQLVVKHWAEQGRRYLIALLAIGGLLIAWFGFLIGMDVQKQLDTFFQFTAYYIGLYLVGCLFASMAFSEMNSKAGGIGYLCLPASHLEKLLCVVLYNVVLFFIAYTLVFYLADVIMGQLSHRLIAMHRATSGKGLEGWEPASLYNIFTGAGGPIPDKEFHFFLYAYFAIQAAFILGSIYFPRYAFIKTIISVLLFALLVAFFFVKCIEENLPAGWKVDHLLQWSQINSTQGVLRQVRLPEWAEGTLMFLLRFGGPLVFLTVAYHRLKEKEV